MKSYNYKAIRDTVKKTVKAASYSPNNPYGYTAWTHHIVPVVNISIELGKKVSANKEVVELAAYLHDYSAVLDKKYIPEHHKHSAKMGEELLKKLKCPDNLIDNVKECILEHRASKPMKKTSIESRVLASADAMSHFTELADMMLLVYGVHKFSTVEGAVWLKKKLQRSWKKIMPEGKIMIKEDYDIAMKILNKAINNKN